jgi:hypothetical protein
MLPIITIGLSPAGRDVVERIAGGREVTHHESADDAAQYLLADKTGQSEYPNPFIPLEPNGTDYRAHIVYGDDSYGPVVTATLGSTAITHIPVSGMVALITDSMGDNLYGSRRVVAGSPEDRQIQTLAAQAMSLLHPQMLLVVDQLPTSRGWEAAAVRMLESAEERVFNELPPLDMTAAADAAREVARLGTLVARGEARPGFFEEQDRARHGR